MWTVTSTSVDGCCLYTQNRRQVIGHLRPRLALIERSVHLTAPRSEVQTGWIEAVAGKVVTQHRHVRIVLRQSVRERLPGFAGVLRSIDAQPLLRRPALLVRVERNDVRGAASPRVRDDRETKVG